MQQRRVRLGDVLDDYCPRERRITNHAVVAMIEEQVKQTRCSTCDAEHEYNGGKVPAARRKKATGVLADVPEGLVRPRAAAPASLPLVDDEPDTTALPDLPAATEAEPPVALAATDHDADPADDRDADDDLPDHHWGHRPLIRATLPRQEGQVPERKAPDFTMRHTNGGLEPNRNNGQRPRGPRPGRPGQGQPRQAQGSGQGQNARFGPPRASRQGGGHPGQNSRPGSGQAPRQSSGQAPRQGSGQAPRQSSGQGSGQGPRHGSGQPPRHGSGQAHGGAPQGNRPGQAHGDRPAGQNRGPRPAGGGRKRGR